MGRMMSVEQSDGTSKQVGTRRDAEKSKRDQKALGLGAQLAELDRFAESLSRRIAALAESGHVLEGNNDQPPRFMDYARTRNLTSECLAFMIVIERRVDALPEEHQERYRIQCDRQFVAVWSTLLECSLAFLHSVSQEEHLPLGSREVFLREIKTLHDAHGTLSQNRFKGLVPEDVLVRQRQAEKILNEIIDRAPRLLDLG